MPPRATSVLEWTGEAGKPKASRIVPVTVFVDGQYQDGGLYLAKPAPLAVESDTVYELERAGIPQGLFNIAGGQNIGGSWFGFGEWRPLEAPKPVKKLPQSKNPPKMVQDHDPDRPHFKGGDAKPPGDTSAQGDASKPADSSSSTQAPAEDPDKPTLHRRAEPKSTDSGQPSSSNGAGQAPDDPDRPHLKKRSDVAAKAAAPVGDGAPVTSVNESDPDRPKMLRGKAAASEKELEATRLTGMPADLQQMAAVSDPTTREEHPFTYQWANPEDEGKMKSALEAIAIKAVLAGITPPIVQGHQTTVQHAGSAAAVGPKSSLSRHVIAKMPLVVLSDKDFRAYELSYGGGATLVFTAKAVIGAPVVTTGASKVETNPIEKYITLIAQPDFDGVPQVRLQSVTDTAHFDVTPRMRLVDAVDTDGDNRAELVFELRRKSDRQFGIYRVRGLRAEQTFATAVLPYETPQHIEITPN